MPRPIQKRHVLASFDVEYLEVGEGRTVIVPQAQRRRSRRRIAYGKRNTPLRPARDCNRADRRKNASDGPLLRPYDLAVLVRHDDERLCVGRRGTPEGDEMRGAGPERKLRGLNVVA